MTESEWKTLRTVKEVALERLCGSILDESRAVIDGPGTSHERFLRLFQVVRDRDREVAWAFDGVTRSAASQKLGVMLRLGLVTDDELARFSPETQDTVRFVASMER